MLDVVPDYFEDSSSEDLIAICMIFRWRFPVHLAAINVLDDFNRAWSLRNCDDHGRTAIGAVLQLDLLRDANAKNMKAVAQLLDALRLNARSRVHAIISMASFILLRCVSVICSAASTVSGTLLFP